MTKALSGNPGVHESFGPGDVVAVQGAGPIGLAAGVTAKLLGASEVILVGGPKHRLDLAEKLGVFDTFVNIDEVEDKDARVAEVKKNAHGGVGPDMVVECTGVASAIPEGIEMVRRGGTLVELGAFVDVGDTTINPFKHLCYSDVHIVGQYGAAPHYYDVAIKLLKNAWDFGLPLDKMVTHRFKISEAQKAMETAMKLDSMKAVFQP